MLKKIREGDEEAFSALFNLFKDDVYHLSMSLTRSAEIAEDIVQDIFLKLWLQRADLPVIDNFNAYMATVTRNTIINLFRANNRLRKREYFFQEYIGTAATGSDFADKIQEKQYNEILEKILLVLPTQQAKVFRCIKQQEMSRNDTAMVLGLSPETVKKHLERALKNIRALLIAHFNDQLLLQLILFSIFFL